MIDQNMVKYIADQLQNGYDVAAVKNYLVQQGYDATMVNESANYIYVSKTQQNAQPLQSGLRPMIYVGFWKRFVATLLDSLIFGIPFYLIELLLINLNQPTIIYALSLVYLMVYIYLEGMKGGTPGKLIMHMKIVNDDGKFIGIPKAILRYIGKMLSTIILCIGFFMIGWDAKKQGLHDKIAHTFVIQA